MCSVSEATWENRSVSHIICQGLLLTAESIFLITEPQSCPSFVMTLALVVCPPLKLSAAEVFLLHSGTGWFITTKKACGFQREHVSFLGIAIYRKPYKTKS